MSIYLQNMGGEETAPDLLFIHGFGADHLTWSAVAPAFTGSHRVWTVDLPGHGRSAIGEAFSPRDMAIALRDALDEKLRSPFGIVGHSLGGAVALELAHLAPDRVDALTLMAPAGVGGALDAEFVRKFPELETVEQTREILLQMVARPRLVNDAMADYVLRSLQRETTRVALRRIAEAVHAFEPPSLPEQVPVALVWGKDDRVNVPDPAAIEALGHATHWLPDTGHMPHVESPSKTKAILAATHKAQGG